MLYNNIQNFSRFWEGFERLCFATLVCNPGLQPWSATLVCNPGLQPLKPTRTNLSLIFFTVSKKSFEFLGRHHVWQPLDPTLDIRPNFVKWSSLPLFQVFFLFKRCSLFKPILAFFNKSEFWLFSIYEKNNYVSKL